MMQSKVGQSKIIVPLGRGDKSRLCIIKGERDQKPIYRQIADELTRLIDEGLLPDGSRLPTVREFASQLEVTRVTVQNAYNELRARDLIDATIGKGTFVSCPHIAEPAQVALSPAQVTPDRVMADLSVFKERSDIISLAMAEPDKRLLPAREFLRLFRSFEDRAEQLLSYGPYQGAPQLRQMIAGFVKEKGIEASADSIIVTTGVTQGLSLTISALCQPGDKVMVEQPTYLGVLSLLQSFGLEAIGVSLQQDGPDLETIASTMKRERPKVFYTIPSYHNPSGVCMSQEKRLGLLALAKDHGVTIVEDDVYGPLRFHAESHPAIKANDSEGHVVYVSSFSKLLLPGLRLGYLIPPPNLKDRLMSLVRCRELCGSMLLQHGLTEFLRRGLLHQHLQRVRPEYKKRRDTLLAALEEFMPEDVTWSKPDGGFCCWVNLPEQGNFDDLYREALDQGVAFTPGSVFFLNSNTTRHFRLCYSTQPSESIRKAIQILGGLVRQCMRRPILREENNIYLPSEPVV